MTWLDSPCGLSRIGFMSTVASTPAARAWANWARPISPPPGQTAALLDMFWALNGATRTPRRANTRHSPATSVLLPADDAVPCTMSTGASPLATCADYAVGLGG